MDWITVIEQDPLMLYAAALLLGLVVGSFLNVVILRLPRMLEAAWRDDCAELDGQPPAAGQRLTLAHPGSSCSHCGHRIRPHENIPLLSYLILQGRCSACGNPIGLRYPLVEAGTALLTLLVVIELGLSWQGGAALLLTWALIALAVIDHDTQLLPDSITLPVLWIGLILSLFTLFTDAHSAIIGAVVGYLSLWSVYHLFRLATGKEGMGYGDFKLLALLGAWLGWQALPQIILLSALTGAILGVVLILSGRHARGTPMPFGPFLASAGWISLLWGPEINRIYLNWVGL
ncbi:MAG: prepilin peptidase [Sphingobacteriia bacterium]|nr:prepilin peptidase [Sphingobacteriia bacterium]NCC38165.1 prepilin peptidase [Gammaproteobacteria bacterium]